jgi:4-hydroxybenzoate polyprenyltransferase
MIILLLLSTTLLLILSKFLDCYTTSKYMKSVSMERNRLARTLMLKYGKENVIWGVFGLTIIISLLSLWLVWKIQTEWYWRLTYIVLGVFISYAQFAVAYTNYSGKLNLFTRWLMKRKHYR